MEVLFESNAVSGSLHAHVMVQMKSGICAGVDVVGVWEHWSPGGCFFTGILKAECRGHNLVGDPELPTMHAVAVEF